jgi:rhodanese-related sulfurtransferase
VSDHSRHSGKSRNGVVVQTIREAFWISLAGIVIALVANGISPRGLRLSRNYFPQTQGGSGAQAAALKREVGSAADRASNQTAPGISISAAERLKANGLQLVEGERVAELTQDIRYRQELVVFIDAREEAHFLEGHIPGAYELDRYHPERELAAVLQVCQGAEQVVVYCSGGDCEDSEFAAIMLRDSGIPNEKLFVYAGGIKDWRARNGATETGPRQSPSVREAK